MTSKVRCDIHGMLNNSFLRAPWHILTAPKESILTSPSEVWHDPARNQACPVDLSTLLMPIYGATSEAGPGQAVHKAASVHVSLLDIGSFADE